MSASKVLLGVVVGLAAGALLGVMLAPDSGEKTRKKISKKGEAYVDDLKMKFNDFLDGFMEKVDSTKEEASNMAHDMADKAKSKYNDLKNDLKTEYKTDNKRVS
ncbi:MAG TPA: YtxH domain-containing protein [Saprospiraceae bacterium]|nr:YtxH domain-containing protein [Saprospiraceae bacterium]